MKLAHRSSDELLPHQGEIDPKYHFIFDAPTTDDRGNRSQIRFSRKAKEQFVTSEVDGKASGWKATFENGAWVEQGSAEPVAKKKPAAKKASAKKKSPAKKPTIKKVVEKNVAGK